MLSENTKGFLNELRTAGTDPAIIASLERDLDSKPATSQTVDRRILAQAGFSQYQTQRDNEVKILKDQLSELASNKGVIASSSDPEIIRMLTERNEALEKILIEEEGYDANEVKNISFNDDENAIVAKLKQHLIDKGTTERKQDMNTNIDPNKRYVDETVLTDVVKTAAANMGAFNVNVSARIAKYFRECDKLGIDITDDQMNNFANTLVKGMEEGKSPDAIADAHFGFSAKRLELDTANREAEKKSEYERGRTEALKENGVVIRRDMKRDHPIFDRELKKHVGGVNKEKDDEGKETPTNRFGDKEVFRNRPRDEVSRRVKHAANAEERWSQLAPHYDEQTETYSGSVNT